MVPFAGYDMPVQYAAGVLKEHLHTRDAAGLFDVSHMGQIVLSRRSPARSRTRRWRWSGWCRRIFAVAPGRQRYAQFTNDAGGILDDLMVANFGDHLFLVVNAACKDADEAHLRAHLSDACVIEPLADRALIALQGPKAAKRCWRNSVQRRRAMRFMDAGPRQVLGIDCFVSRSGYTGEDGFEISVPAEQAESWRTRCSTTRTCCRSGLAPATACGSRPGFAFTATTSTPRPRRSRPRWNGRSRRAAATAAPAPAAFPARTEFSASFENGAPRRRVGLRPEGRAPVREGAPLFADAASIRADRHGHLGRLRPEPQCAGGDGLSARRPRRAGSMVFAELRGQRLPLRVAAMPFVPNTYKR